MPHEPGDIHQPAHSLLLPFDTDSRDFVRGFELGALWREVSSTDQRVEATIHISNAEMVLRMADVHQRNVVSHEHDETWMTVIFEETVGLSPQPNDL